ncbi:carboxypeptidase-like regulatory domain-containing protein [Dysgonomonas sp. OttesenSCG-928-M03]|nr:carboxypeptidase-like regulatory domain-containing protein [Dysgonomonas sp. OttesenSCG-928-M03]
MRKSLVIVFCILYGLLCSAQEFTTPPFANNIKTGVLSMLDIDVKIKNGIATTTLDMSFEQNGYQWQDEAIIEFTLLPGQHISQFKLDVNGKLRDAVVVEKLKGRAAYEEIISRRVDPGLLEMTGFNSYRLRVYPILRAEYKRAVIVYEEKLLKQGDSYLYKLPVKYNLALGEGVRAQYKRTRGFSLDISVEGNMTDTPAIIETPVKGISFVKAASIYSTSVNSKELPSGTFTVSIPTGNSGEELLLEKPKLGTDRTFLLSIHSGIKPSPKVKPKNIALYLDNSLSMQPVSNSLFDLLGKYIRELNELSVTMYTVGDKVEFSEKIEIKNGNSAELFRQISQTKFDGVCYFDTLDFNRKDCDEIWFISDGVSNATVKPAKKTGDIPVMVFNYKEVSNDTMLSEIASSSGGTYINLAKNPSPNVESLMLIPGRLVSTEYLPKQLAEVYSYPVALEPGERQDEGHTYVITGVQKKNNAKLILNFGRGNTILRSDTVTISNSTTGKYNGFVERFWLNNKIRSLNPLNTGDLKKITDMGMQYGMVTPNTSLIVLETIEDYLKYEIIPPTEDLQKKYFSNLQRIKDQELGEKLKKEDILKEKFTDRKRAWTAFPDKKEVEKLDEYLDKRSERRKRAEERKRRRQERMEQWEREQRNRERREWEMEFGHRNKPRKKKRRSSNASIKESGEVLVSDSKNTISGTIMDDMGEPLIGCSVIIDGTTTGTIADIDGKYTIELPANRPKLRVQYVGYESQAFTPRKKEVNIVMKEYEMYLDEVVVSGYSSPSPSSSSPAPVTREPITNNKEVRIGESEYSPVFNDSIYLDEMKNLPARDIYTRYLNTREEYADIPFFYISVANLLYKKGNNKLAYRVISNLAELSSSNPMLIRPCAKFMLQLGYTQQATALWESDLAQHPDQLMPYRELGLAYAASERYQDAIDIMYSAIQFDFKEEDKVVLLTDMNAVIAEAKRKNVKLKLGEIDNKFIFPISADKRFVLGSYAKGDIWLSVKKEPDIDSRHGSYSRRGAISSGSNSARYAPVDFIVKQVGKGDFNVSIHDQYYESKNEGLARIAYLEVYTGFGTEQQQKEVIFIQTSQAEKQWSTHELIIPSRNE